MQESRSKIRKLGSAERSEALKSLPGVSRLLHSRPMVRLLPRYGKGLVTDLLRERLEELRSAIRSGRIDRAELKRRVTPSALAREIGRRAEELLAPRPRVVINATGVVVHTNLGRSLLSGRAAQNVRAAATQYVDLEYDLTKGGRGSRHDQIEPLMARILPGRSMIAVNNNAAAILLCLRALGRGKEVLVSRGELVEIGGSFRVPDILAASGARLREVGTTNRTRLADYSSAITPRTGLILKVHTSNFRIVGFTEETSVAALSGVARENGLPLVVDWGSGDLVDLRPLGILDESPVAKILEAGADLVTFSGDKLLGGPQAGIVVGDPGLVERLRRDPLARVCRLDRLLIAALSETLGAYVRGREFEELPTLRMLTLDAKEIGRRASRVRRRVGSLTHQGRLLSLTDGVSKTGGGSSPGGERPTTLLAVGLPARDAAPLEKRLRSGEPPVIARVQDGRLLLDLRTVLPEQDEPLAERLAEAILAELGGEETASRARKAPPGGSAR